MHAIVKIVYPIKRFFSLGIVIIASIFLLQRSDLEQGDPIEKVRAFTRNMEFDFISWTWHALWAKGSQKSIGVIDYVPESQHSEIVLSHLENIDFIHHIENDIRRLYTDPSIEDPDEASQDLKWMLSELSMIRENMAPVAESIIQNQLSETVSNLNLSIGGQPFPPILYNMTPTPKALIVSPRDIIRQDANIAINPEISIDHQVDLEEEIDHTLDVSSLVVGIGGVGLYPTMVMETSNINWLTEVVSHEWVHNFLTLRPLGASYGTSPELRIINETVANLAEKEIGSAMIEAFYPEYVPLPLPVNNTGEEGAITQDEIIFDFNNEMHKTRVAVDAFFEGGEIEAAEIYMEERRQFFWDNGYQIRKLNQAYFAFYGAYADEPGGASGAVEDPIGDAVRELRSQSPSLAHFLNRISWMWTLDQLQAAVRGGS